ACDGIAFGAIDNPIDAREAGLWQTSGFRLGQLALCDAYFCLGFIDIGAISEGTFQTLFERQALAWRGRHGGHGPHEKEADEQTEQESISLRLSLPHSYLHCSPPLHISRVQCAAIASHDGEIQRWRARQRLGILGSRTVGKQRQA